MDNLRHFFQNFMVVGKINQTVLTIKNKLL